MMIVDLAARGLRGDYLMSDGGLNPRPTDNFYAWSALVAEAEVGDEWKLPWALEKGHYAFGGPIILPRGVAIVGEGGMRASLVRNYQGNGETFLDLSPYARIENIAIQSGKQLAPSGVAIGGVATNADNAPMQNRLRNVMISAFGTGPQWFGGLNLDAINGAPQYGARDIVVDDLIVARCAGYCVRMAAVNASRFSNMAMVGETEQGEVWFTGSENNPNNGVYWSGASAGKIWCENVHSAKFDVSGIGQVAINDNCVGVTISAASYSAEPLFVRGHGNFVYAEGREWKSPP
jgi:hypothetical protein